MIMNKSASMNSFDSYHNINITIKYNKETNIKCDQL